MNRDVELNSQQDLGRIKNWKGLESNVAFVCICFFLVVTCKDHSNEARAQKRHMKGLNIVDLFESLVGRT